MKVENTNSNPPLNGGDPHETSSSTAIRSRPLKSRSKLESIRTATILMFKPEHKVGKPPGVLEGLKAIILSSWLNLLLVFIPVSWALHFALPQSFANRDTIIFVFCFLAIIPLAKLLSFATEELAMRVGQTLAGLLNATLGNAVELIVAIIALVKCELRIVQSSLVGSVLSNLLLVLGMCFFAGGLKYSEQGFGASSTQLNSSLLTISVIAVLLPAAFHFSSANGATGLTPGTEGTEGNAILSVSRGVAIILLFIYGGYLAFQLWSHTNLYNDDLAVASTKYDKPLFQGIHQGIQRRFHHGQKPESTNAATTNVLGPNTSSSPVAQTQSFMDPGTVRSNTFSSMMGLSGASVLDSQNPSSTSHHHTSNENILGSDHSDPESQVNEKEEDKEEIPTMSVLLTIILLISVTVLVAITAEFLVDSIDGMTQGSNGITKEFVGVVLLPIVGNAAEHVTAVTVSVKDKLNLSLGVAVGSSIQIALFVIPFIVTLAWILGKPLTLLFDPYESVAMFLSVLTVNYVVQDGKSNWLEGFILMALYLILAVTFWFYPGSDPSGGLLSQCTK